jgi:predicted lipoprotein with Yx(FWY)xxD motif
MKRFAIGLAILVTAGAGGLEAAPWKRMPASAGDGYSETMGTIVSASDRASANPSNCYGACATIWGPFVDGSAAKVASGEP